jgi:hypothetical protein
MDSFTSRRFREMRTNRPEDVRMRAKRRRVFASGQSGPKAHSLPGPAVPESNNLGGGSELLSS